MTPEREGAKKTKINKMPQNEREEDMPETEKCSRIIPSWAIMPSGYEIAQDGSINKRLRGAVVDRGDGQKPAQAPDKVIKVCSSQIYVSNLMYVAESDNAQRIELAFENVHTSKEVKIVMAYEDYTDLTKLRTQLSQFGFMLCSSNAQLVMEYLMAFELSNKDTIPTGSAVTRAGWVYIHPLQ